MTKLAAIIVTATLIAANAAAQESAAKPKPKRINRAIELLEAGQPIYYTGGEGGYEEGRKMAATKADYINYGMEHEPFNVKDLREFMRGLVEAGPTRSGHRTPTVIVTLPILGIDPASMLANAWVAQQVMAAGVHGILLCRAESAEAVKIFVEQLRYPFAPKYPGLDVGSRGNGSANYAAGIWGVSQNEYMRIAEPWPLNKEGEFLLGIKIESPVGADNAPKTTKVPGIAFAEWGPGDNSFYLLGRPGTYTGNREDFPVMKALRARIYKSVKEANLFFLNSCNEQNVVDMIKDGVMICTGGETPAAEKGRQFTKRPGVW